jgi:CDP-diacylglycerol--glycerol-3-phosphate 3-phosphatidyltransferase/cardiolipin synthase
MESAGLLTLPNAVSLSRLLLAAAFVATRDPILRVTLIVAASGTDFLDGWLARRRRSATKWGALIDPIADRAFVFAAVSSFLVGGEITSAQYFIILSRDLATAVGFLVARSVAWLRPVEFKARWLGKTVTALQFLTLVAVIVQPRQVSPLVLVTGVVSAVAIVDYTLALWRARVT